MKLPNQAFFSLVSRSHCCVGNCAALFHYAGSDAAEPKPARYKWISSLAASTHRGSLHWKKVFTPSAVWMRPFYRARARPILCARWLSGGADFGFADIATVIVAKSRGIPVQAAAQFGYVGTTILWRDEGVIKGIKDLEGKSLAISPGQAQWFLMPAYCRINKIDFKSIKIQETAAPIQPAALATKKADFIVMFRASNDEVAEQAASKVGVKLSRVFMKDTGLDIYGTSLIVKDDDVKKRPDFVRAYVEGTLEGLRYSRDHQEEALKILLKHKPELDPALTTLQLKNALTEVFLPFESAQIGLGYMKPDIVEKTVRMTNEYFDVGRKVAANEVFTNQFIKR